MSSVSFLGVKLIKLLNLKIPGIPTTKRAAYSVPHRKFRCSHLSFGCATINFWVFLFPSLPPFTNFNSPAGLCCNLGTTIITLSSWTLHNPHHRQDFPQPKKLFLPPPTFINEKTKAKISLHHV